MSVPMSDSCPVWNLTDLYEGIDSAAIQTDIRTCRADAAALADRAKGRLADLNAESLVAVIVDYEAVQERLGKILSHAQLVFAANTNDPAAAKHHQSMREVGSEIGAVLLFVELELARLDQARLDELFGKFGARPFWPMVEAGAGDGTVPVVRGGRNHDCRTCANRAGAWVRLFDETMTSLRFPFENGQVTESEILDALSSINSDRRKAAGQSLSTVLKQNERLFALVLNTIAKDKQIEDGWRGFERPVAARNLANDVDDVVVDALVSAVDSRNVDLAHRYYALKAGWMGQKQIDWWDRNAPLPGDNNRQYSWEEAKSIVCDAFAGFDPLMADNGD